MCHSWSWRVIPIHLSGLAKSVYSIRYTLQDNRVNIVVDGNTLHSLF